MTSQKTTLTVRAARRWSYWLLFPYAAWLCYRGMPFPEGLIERLFVFYVGENPPVSGLRRRWRRSALARYLDRRALYSQQAALWRILHKAQVLSDLERWCLDETWRINDQLAATYR